RPVLRPVLALVPVVATSGNPPARRQRDGPQEIGSRRESMSKPRIGYIGVGLMGHGAAKNIVEKGYALTIMGHRNREPVDDLVARGAKEGRSGAELAQASDILFLCLPSSVEVETMVYGAGGVLEG